MRAPALITLAAVTALSIANATSTTFADWQAEAVNLVQTAYDRVLGRVSDQSLDELASADERLHVRGACRTDPCGTRGRPREAS